MKVLH
jgi:flagellar biogenesis protein FliO